MIVLLYQTGCKRYAKAIKADLRVAFADHVEITLVAADNCSSWPSPRSWDDILVVLYNKTEFLPEGDLLIAEYLRQNHQNARLLPVAVGKGGRTPPKEASSIKALTYDSGAAGPNGRLVNRIGAMLGLRVQGRDCKIFISYRASDGSLVAGQLYEHLKSLGYDPFLDEAKEIDGQTKILPGSPVQQEIDEALDKSNLVLLLDTPDAPHSRWIMHEVETADSLLLPILPICFRADSDPRKGPRFRTLLALQRWVPLDMLDFRRAAPLLPEQLEKIVHEAELYMCEFFRRKCRVPFIVEKEFVSRGFAWKVLDQRMLMFESSQKGNWRTATKVLSHCSVFDQIYGPALQRFGEFLKSTRPRNYSLFIYDGQLLPNPQLEQIVQGQSSEVIILHHQELAAYIGSNFRELRVA